MDSSALRSYDANLAYARRLTADLTDAQATAQPAPGMNHAAWIIGHLVFVNDLVARLAGVDAPVLDPNYAPALNNQSKPVADPSAYPPLADLMASLERAHAQVVEAVSRLTPEQFAAPNPFERARDRFPTTGDFIAHLITVHDATHLGQLSAWRRALGLPAV